MFVRYKVKLITATVSGLSIVFMLRFMAGSVCVYSSTFSAAVQSCSAKIAILAALFGYAASSGLPVLEQFSAR